jgi:hypothetical protein
LLGQCEFGISGIILKNNTKITFLLVECNDRIDLNLDHNGLRVLSIDQKLDKPLRVIGFNKPRITPGQLLEFANREVSEDASISEIGFIREYIKSKERTISSDVRQLQQMLRKIIIHSESKEIAKQLLASLLQSQTPQHAECSSNPFEKKPHPWAKCTNCESFYRQVPESGSCVSCGGFIKNELRPNTWFECQVCEGTGYDARFKKACSSCGEKGWLFAELFKL